MVDRVQSMSLLDSVLKAQTTGVEIGVAMLKKSQDVATQQGEAMIQMIEQSVPQESGKLLDTYA